MDYLMDGVYATICHHVNKCDQKNIHLFATII